MIVNRAAVGLELSGSSQQLGTASAKSRLDLEDSAVLSEIAIILVELQQRMTAIREAEEKQAGFPAALQLLRETYQEIDENLLAIRLQSNVTMNIHAIVRLSLIDRDL
jgi:hypothetical protein